MDGKLIEDLLKRELKKVKTVPDGFKWHLHSMDVANLIRLGIQSDACSRITLNNLVGYPVHVDDRYARWVNFQPALHVHDATDHTINPGGMVLQSLARHDHPLPDTKPLWVKLADLLRAKQINDLVPPGFHWYLHPETIAKFHGNGALSILPDDCWKKDHPDDLNLAFKGARIRSDKNAPVGDPEAIFDHSASCTAKDKDWYLLWARKWNVDRKTAKHMLLFYVYDNEQSLQDKRLIRKHYANIARDDKTVLSVDVEPPATWTEYAKAVHAGGNPDFIRQYAEVDCLVSNQLQQREKNRLHKQRLEYLIDQLKTMLKDAT